LGEVAVITHFLKRQGMLSAIEEQVRFARRRFGHYEVIDFVAVLLGYAISGERTLETFYERVQPFATAFMALFGRERLPARSTLSRFLASLSSAPVEALRTLMLSDLLSRPLCAQEEISGLWDRAGQRWVLIDIDGTREAARQRALPRGDDLPAPHRRLCPLCAKGYTGRKRGEVVRTRTTVLQAHSYQWLGSFGNPGNGEYWAELHQAVASVASYCTARQLPEHQVLLRLDGQYGTGAVLGDLAGFAYVVRGKDYHLLDRDEVQTRLHLPPDQQFSRPDSSCVRTLYDCPSVAVGPEGAHCRIVIATHPASQNEPRVGVQREAMVYELFLTNLPQAAFTVSDVVALYLHRGAFENALADEDQEQDPDRWCSHSACGQEFWQILSQWLWNIRLELGHQLEPTPVRTTEFAPAISPPSPHTEPSAGYVPPQLGSGWKAGRFHGADFSFHSDGTLRCPANQRMLPNERRREADGSLRVVYAASIRSCRPCPLRQQCQWLGSATAKPRQVSVLLHPLPVGSAPLLWRDWSRRKPRRACWELLRTQRVEVQVRELARSPDQAPPPPVLSRAKLTHMRLSWEERLARNEKTQASGRVSLTLFGIPEAFATRLGLTTT
jgi:hypothetical protein